MRLLVNLSVAVLIGIISNLVYELILKQKTITMEWFNDLNITQALMLFIIADLVFMVINLILSVFGKPKVRHLFEWQDQEKERLKLENKYLKLRIKELEKQQSNG